MMVSKDYKEIDTAIRLLHRHGYLTESEYSTLCSRWSREYKKYLDEELMKFWEE